MDDLQTPQFFQVQHLNEQILLLQNMLKNGGAAAQLESKLRRFQEKRDYLLNRDSVRSKKRNKKQQKTQSRKRTKTKFRKAQTIVYSIFFSDLQIWKRIELTKLIVCSFFRATL